MIGAIILIVLLLTLYLLANQKNSEIPKLTKKKKEKGKRTCRNRKGVCLLPGGIGRTGLYIEQWIRFFTKRKDNTDEKLLISEEESRNTAANLYGGAWCIALFGGIVGLALGIINMTDGKIERLTRPDFGETRTETVVVNGLREKGEIRIQVSGKDPAEGEMDAAFDSTFQWLCGEILGENSENKRISRNLRLIKETDNGISVKYQSSNREVLSDFGIILAEDLPEEGVPVELSVTLSYKEEEKSYRLPLIIVREQENKSDLEKLEEAVSAINRDSVEKEALLLPEDLEGKRITFEREKKPAAAVAMLFLLLASGLVVLFYEKQREQLKKREEELALSYSKMISKFSALLDAGMSTRTAWLKLADDYRRDKGQGKAEKEYAMEEMMIAANRLRSGIPEETAYLEFGRRTGLHRYMKFANLLSISQRQGIADLKAVLKTEMRSALEERKNMAMKRGEEAGTRQIFPMLLMLGIIIIILIIPAFMSL